MSTYKALVGKKIKSVSSDPSDSADGQMWYNTTTQSLRGLAIIEAWSAASNTNTSKQRSGGCGTQTAGLNCGGFAAPPGTAANNGTEEYNGSGWSNAPNLNTARGNTKLVGTQTAGVFFGQGGGGQSQSGVTEEYNGTAWTTVNPMANAINYRSGCGIETALLATGGNVPGTNRTDKNEEYDGTNWTTGGALPQKQSSQGQAGTQTAAINSFGYTNNPVPGNSGDTFNAISLEYDGSSWTAGPNGMGVVEITGYAMGSGTQTDAIFAGAPSTNSCKYDGTNFTVGPALAIAQDSASHGSTSASATWIAKGSPVPSVGNRVQEFNRSTNSITAAAWAAGGSLNTTRRSMHAGQCGLQTAGLGVGGYIGPSRSGATEEYDGGSWTSGNNAPTKSSRGLAGTQTAAIEFGGLPSGPSSTNTSSVYDGTNWTSAPNLNNSRGYSPSGGGTSTATIAIGGYAVPPGAYVTVTEYFNGSAWTSQPGTGPNHYAGAGGGTQSAAWCVGIGGFPSSNQEAFNWDGSSWTASGNYLMNSVVNHYGGGTQTAGWVCGGEADPPSYPTSTNHYDGTVWSTAPNMGTGRTQGGSNGTQAAGLIFAGYTGSNTAATEEFTGETETANIETFTTS